MEATNTIQRLDYIREIPVQQALWQRIILLTVLAYEGLGGLVGGVLLIVAPDGHLMKLPVSMMRGAFQDFLIPGIILFGLGILGIIAFFSVLRRRNTDWLMAGLSIGGYYIWFIVEIIILDELHWLHLMWGIPVLLGWMVMIPLIALRHETKAMQRILLTCGMLSSIWYILINIYVPFFYPGYSPADLTVSELSAIGAPSRILWVLSCTLYLLLFTAFGWGVLKSGGNNRALKWVGILIIIYCFFNLYWPPMHIRGLEKTWTDTMHIIWAVITIGLMFLLISIGSKAFGRNFKIYSWISILCFLIFGALTGMLSDELATGEPTPMIGVWERINIGVFMLWVAVLSFEIKMTDKAPFKIFTN